MIEKIALEIARTVPAVALAVMVILWFMTRFEKRLDDNAKAINAMAETTSKAITDMGEKTANSVAYMAERTSNAIVESAKIHGEAMIDLARTVSGGK